MDLDILSTYTLIALMEQLTPTPSFFRERYFPTGAGDLYTTDYVLTEFTEGSRKMAAVVAPRIGDIPVERGSFEIHRYEPPKVAPSRLLTIDDLKKKGFGEAPFANLTPEKRAGKIVQQDLRDLERRIAFREEWFCVQTMLSNGFTVPAMADEVTAAENYDLRFYDTPVSDHLYTVSGTWSSFADMKADVVAMCDKLADRGLPVSDLLLGPDAAGAALAFTDFQNLLDKNSGIETGKIRETLSRYRGIVYLGEINFSGYMLGIYSVRETYVSDAGVTTPYFPAKGAMVTAPGCGRLTYGAVTQIPRGGENFVTISGTRVPKLIVDDKNDTRTLRLTSRPLAMPKNKSPYVYAANVVA